MVAGISRTVSPSRLALAAGALVFRGVWGAPVAAASGAETGVAVRARPATYAEPEAGWTADFGLRIGLRCGDVTLTRGRISGVSPVSARAWLRAGVERTDN